MPFDGDVRRSPAPTAIRLTLLVLTLATTFAAGLRFLHIFEDLRAEPLEIALLMLFVISFSWLALSFWSAIGGYLSLLSRWRAPGLTIPSAPALNGRTAILMPIYNEDPTRVFAALQAMYEGLTAAGAIEASSSSSSATPTNRTPGSPKRRRGPSSAGKSMGKAASSTASAAATRRTRATTSPIFATAG